VPLVLTQNEATESGHEYADRFGEAYEYPVAYRNLIRTGEPFVYYRGRKKAGGGHQPQVYLGVGVVGNIRPSPTPGRLICEVGPLGTRKAGLGSPSWRRSRRRPFPFARGRVEASRRRHARQVRRLAPVRARHVDLCCARGSKITSTGRGRPGVCPRRTAAQLSYVVRAWDRGRSR